MNERQACHPLIEKEHLGIKGLNGVKAAIDVVAVSTPQKELFGTLRKREDFS